MTSTVLWIAGASLLSFTVSALFAGKLRLRRNAYLLVYLPTTALFVGWFFIREGIDVSELLSRNGGWGVVGATVAGAIVVANVLSQGAYPRRRGVAFLVDLLWPGLAYGLVDALLLSVFPVLVVRTGLAAADLGALPLATIAMAASLAVTFFYHVGYPEFRNHRVLWTVFGNGVMTLSFLITGSALAALLPHAAMHIAVICHGRESTGQLPPHYTTV